MRLRYRGGDHKAAGDVRAHGPHDTRSSTEHVASMLVNGQPVGHGLYAGQPSEVTEESHRRLYQ